MTWTTRDIPHQTGRLAIVTGANSGTGYETALELARKGAEVVLAVRDVNRGQAAAKRIRGQVPKARLRVEALDLSKQAPVTAFAERVLAEGAPIHMLINNAGVMMLPKREVTVDGFEMQWATNYLGHFALTARLMPLLKEGLARVVHLSSVVHRRGRIAFDDLNHERDYRPFPVYGQSKLAMLMFGLELARRSDANGWGLTSVAAHPGYARTGLIANGPLIRSPFQRAMMRLVYRPLIEPLISHSAAAGALPILRAATEPGVKGGAYLGPTRLTELKGPPGPAKAEPHALVEADAARLFDMTEAELGVRFA
jgi:NAD(P)-dependent dehydrogenase (short-subunit alcohol dehydrogenase family)